MKGRLRILQIIVGKISDQTSRKRRKKRKSRRPVFLQDLTDRNSRILCFKGKCACLHVTVQTRDLHGRIKAQERIPSPLLLCLRGLQKITMVRNILQLPKNLNRRIKIGKDLRADRNPPIFAACRILQYFLQGWSDLHLSRCSFLSSLSTS